MYNFSKLLFRLIMPAVALFAFAACDEDDEKSSAITVVPETIDVESTGGSVTVNYVLNNPAEGDKPVVKSEQTWVKDIDLTKAGELTFNVAENEEESPREAKVELTYKEVTAVLTVKQAGGPDLPGFTIEISEISDAGVVYTITPEDPNMTYISMVTEKEAYDSFESQQAYFEDELDYFQKYADAKGITLSEYLATVLKKGTVSGPAWMLKPEKTYYIYAYGLSTDGKRLTRIHTQEFTTIPVEHSDVTLGITFKVVGTSSTMTVTPSNDEQRYMFNAIAASEISSDEDILKAIQDEIDYYIEVYQGVLGVPQDEAVERFTYKGVNSYKIEGLDPETEYIGYAISVNRLGSICGDLSTKRFTTGKAISEADKINMTLSSSSESEATVQVSTQLADHYVIGIDKSILWEGMTDEQILNKLANGYQWQAKGGTGSAEYSFYSLDPQTNYSIFAFGYVDGAVTTPLYRLDFSTSAASSADINFTMTYDKYFDGDEMISVYGSKYAKAAGKAVLPVTLSTSGSTPCTEIYYLFYEGDYSDTNTYSDDYFMEDLIEYGDWNYSNCYYPEYDKPYTMIGFGATSEMAIGSISRQVVTLTRSGASPASEYNVTSKASTKTRPVVGKKAKMISLTPAPAFKKGTKELNRKMPYVLSKDSKSPRLILK